MLVNYKTPSAPELVNPETFIPIYLRHATTEAMTRAEEIMTEYMKQSDPDNEPDEMWYYMSLLGAIYEAGRIQGKREERLRHYI